MSDKLKIMVLGGVREQGKNMFAVQVNDEIFVLDAGLKYPDSSLFGIDVVIPDMEFFKQYGDQVVGIFLTHGHADSIGALPYILRDWDIPVFGSKLTIELAKIDVQRENKRRNNQLFNVIDADTEIDFKNASVSFFQTTHSVPDSLGIVIHAPQGQIVYTGDFKFDPSARPAYRTDMTRLAEIAENGVLRIRATGIGSDTTLARIIHAVEQAQGTQAPTQRFVDQFAAIYTPAVFCIALAVAILTPWLLGWTWTQAIYKALVLLVIACPCALVLATPVTVVSGLAAAARRGILIKGGVYLEEARKLRVIALDKTGTITEGKPRLVATEILPSAVPESQVLAWAASLAGHSDHPVSKAIATGLKLPENGLTDFVALAGRGIEARTDGQLLFLGNHRLVEERKLCSAEIEARLQVHEMQGRTVTMLASAQQVLAIFAVADTIKESSREAVADLHRLGVVSIMLTGDNVATAASIAKEAGIDDARGNLLPEDKLAAIEDLQRRYGPTAMTGDGINDAPALARADIGVAMGAAGTDTAMEAADVVIMNDDLRRIPETIRLSRRTHAVLWQNIGLALGIKAIFLGLAVFGNATMWMAVFADMGASLLVVGNGVRILRWTSGNDFR